jgi:hypothetical protein
VADTKISALTAVATPATTDEFPVNQSGASKKMTLAQILAAVRKQGTGSSVAANANGAGTVTVQTLTSNATANSTTTNAVVMTTTSLAAGTYKYRYDIIAQSGATTTAHKFAVNFTGTVTKTVYHLFFPSQGVTAATGVVDQDQNVTTGNVWAHESARANNVTLGPGTDLDTASADIHYVVEGILVVSTSGDLQLLHGSEVAASSQVMSGTTLTLERVA